MIQQHPPVYRRQPLPVQLAPMPLQIPVQRLVRVLDESWLTTSAAASQHAAHSAARLASGSASPAHPQRDAVQLRDVPPQPRFGYRRKQHWQNIHRQPTCGSRLNAPSRGCTRRATNSQRGGVSSARVAIGGAKGKGAKRFAANAMGELWDMGEHQEIRGIADWLPGEDSKLGQRIQSPLCYQLHYRAAPLRAYLI